MTQTAMQQHIEWLESTIEIAQEQTPILVNVLKLCLKDATQRLAMEKEHIRVAYMEGAFEKMRHSEGKEFTMPTEYYNKNFKSE